MHVCEVHLENGSNFRHANIDAVWCQIRRREALVPRQEDHLEAAVGLEERPVHAIFGVGLFGSVKHM